MQIKKETSFLGSDSKTKVWYDSLDSNFEYINKSKSLLAYSFWLQVSKVFESVQNSSPKLASLAA